MKLDVGNLKVLQKKEQFVLQIMMPDESKNYLHSEPFSDINEAVKVRDELVKIGMVIRSDNVFILNDLEYFRIELYFKPKERTHTFHSRMLNVTDVVFERDQLLL